MNYTIPLLLSVKKKKILSNSNPNYLTVTDSIIGTLISETGKGFLCLRVKIVCNDLIKINFYI